MEQKPGEGSAMTWSACARYEIAPAPAGLALVHDFVNTISTGRPREIDLLGSLSDAQAWLDRALATWAARSGQSAAPVRLDAHDLEELVGLRSELLRLLEPRVSGGGHDAPAVHVAAAALRLDRGGHAVLEPRGQGWRYFAAVVLLEVFQAQQAGAWRRLKVCRNARCGAAFYDSSRNNSAVWHSAKLCGNPENLRAHRARQRARTLES
jgi:predicted RNA-binding Zn ribbon-like protein